MHINIYMNIYIYINMTKIKKEYLEYQSGEQQKSSSLKVGTILLYAGNETVVGGGANTNIQNNFLFCHGQKLNRTTNNYKYDELYKVIGTDYGVGDGGVGDFTVPDLRKKFLVGATENANTIHVDGINKRTGGTSSLHPDQYLHSHYINTGAKDTEGTMVYDRMSDNGHGVWNAQQLGYHSHTTFNLKADGTPYASTDAKNFYPHYCVINYIICYKA